MRSLWVLCVLAGTARADELSDLEGRGEELAKASDYTQAIDAFKRADGIKPRAAHACMIGLAYLRRELWPQAEMFLLRCEKRAVPGDQPPEWIDEAEHTLAAKLSAAQIPAVTIAVEPANAAARITVSTFAPDEGFEPQTVHLVPGKNVIEVSAPGFVGQQREIEIRPGEPQTVKFTLVPTQVAPPPPPPARSAAHGSSSDSLVPWIIAGAGVALGGIALAYDELELQPIRDHLEHAQTKQAYAHYRDDFSSTRLTTAVLFGASAAMIGTAIALHYTVFAEKAPIVHAEVGAHGAMVGLTWRR